jgi:hypothetical protein
MTGISQYACIYILTTSFSTLPRSVYTLKGLNQLDFEGDNTKTALNAKLVIILFWTTHQDTPAADGHNEATSI